MYNVIRLYLLLNLIQVKIISFTLYKSIYHLSNILTKIQQLKFRKGSYI